MEIFKTIFTSLNAIGVQYLVVGGIAVFVHGYQRFTGDLDLILFLNDDNLKKFESAMRKLGYLERLPISVRELSNKLKVRDWLENKNLKAFSFFSSDSHNSIVIDVIIEESLNFEEIFKKSVVKSFEDVNIPVVSVDDLIIMKEKAGRAKDEIDLEALRKIKKILNEK